jgi:hypothetical protein
MFPKNRTTLIATLLLTALLAGAAACWFFLRPHGVPGGKEITVEVTHGDGSVNIIEVRTDEEYLGATLSQEGLIQGEQGPFGLYIHTVDGEAAQTEQQEWWGYTKSGQYVEYGVDLCPVATGDHYEFTLHTGYDT